MAEIVATSNEQRAADSGQRFLIQSLETAHVFLTVLIDDDISERIPMSDIMKARKAAGYVRRPRTYAEDRVCSHKGCDTRLSTYNSSSTCRQHTPVRFPRVRGRVNPSEA